MNTSQPTDVTSWSRHPNEQTHPLWWGILGLIFIELTVVAILLVSFFYLWILNSANPNSLWSQHASAEISLLIPTINLGLLGVCGWSMWYGGIVMKRDQAMKFVWIVVLCTICGVSVLCLRWWQFKSLPFAWSDSAYATFLWILPAFHFVHLLSAILGTIAIGWLAAKGYYTKWRYIGVQVDTMYWYFVVASWAAIYVALYGVPLLLEVII